MPELLQGDFDLNRGFEYRVVMPPEAAVERESLGMLDRLVIALLTELFPERLDLSDNAGVVIASDTARLD